MCCECVGVFGLWYPSMSGGVVVDDQGEGGCRRRMPDRGGVRWRFGDETRRIGERIVAFDDGCGRSGEARVVCGPLLQGA